MFDFFCLNLNCLWQKLMPLTQNSILTFIDYITTSIQNFAAKNIIKNRSSIYKFDAKKIIFFQGK